MKGPWQVALAAAAMLTVAAGVASAQTVTVIKAPASAPVELVLNTAIIGSTTASADGIAILDVNLVARRGKNEIDVNIYVDACGEKRRILLVEPGVEGMPPGECLRREIAGTYIMREVTSFVVNVSDPLPTARFRQGPAPEEWLNPPPPGSTPSREWGPLPTGLIAFGGGGLSMFNNQVYVACGDVVDCSGKDSRFAYTGGVDVWFLPFLAAEISYLKPTDVTAQGSGDGYRFKNSLDVQMATVAGKVGIPVGPMRIYGKGGATYSRATSTTTETLDDYTVTVNGVDQVISGGTQTFGLQVKGWRYFFGGGAEIWASKRIAIYGELIQTPIRGDAEGGGEGSIKESATTILGGIRFRITR